VIFKLPSFFSAKPVLWTAVDAGLAGELLAVSVEAKAGQRPRVLHAQRAPSTGWEPAALATLLGGSASRPGRTVAVLARGDYQIMLMQRPPVPAADLERSVRWQVASQVDFAVDDAVIAHLQVPVPPGAAREVSGSGPATPEAQGLYVVAAQAALVETVSQAFKAARHRVDAVDVRETAQRNLAALAEQADECLCLLRVTQQGVQLTFTHLGELYLDRFIAQPLAAWQAAEPFEKARTLERVAQQALRSVAHMKEHHPHLAVRRVLLCPLPPGLELEAPLREQMGLPLETLDLADVLDLSAVPQLLPAEAQAAFFTALGAALRAPAQSTFPRLR
jgi:MSHA biogenesis protein MshI